MPRVLETVLTGRNLLSPVLVKAGQDVVTFNSTVSGANAKAAASATQAAQVQDRAADKITASNVKASTSATTSSQAQVRAHTRAAESATLSARTQESANRALTASNALLGTSLTPLTAKLGAVGLSLAYAGYRGMDFDAAMSQVQAASQASAGTMDQLREAAVKAGADTQYSAVEAAQGITEMSKAGVQAKDILGGGLRGALNLAAAGQISVAEAAETGATALSVFNLKGDQMAHVADLLAAGAGKAQGSVGDMSAALNQSALVANQAGLSIEDTAGALAMFASNGLIGSDAGTSFKTMLQSLTPNSTAAAKAMDAIGFSAYDAQGNFVGLESVAAQLRTGLAGLTEEQRNTTLETIFGSDAVRAASVLYSEGAAGVAQWTAKVDDAGYAQRQAAQLTDNLRGDLERLGGAADSVFTTLGSGAQGPLREVVQALTGIVNVGGDVLAFWNGLPGPVQVTIAAIAALAALRGPLDALWGRIAAGITSTVTGMGMATGATTALGVAAGTARIAMVGLVSAAAPLATIAVLAKAVNDVVQFTQAGDDATTMVRNLDQAIRDADGNEARFLTIRNGVNALNDEMAKAQALIDEYNSHGAVYDVVIGQFQYDADEIRGAQEAVEIFREKIDELEDANARADVSTQRLARSFGITGDEVVALADKYGIDLTGKVSETRRLFENFYSMEFGSKPTEATLQVKGAMEDAKAAVDDAKNAVDQFKLSLDILTGAHVSMIQVESAFQAAVAEAEGAVKDLNGSVLDGSGKLNMQSEAGRKAADVLLDVRDSGNQLIATMIEQGKSSDEVKAKDAELRASFIRSATQMGISEARAKELADQILGIPAERETKIDADTKAANDKIAATQRGIDNLHGRTIEIQVRAAGRFIVNPSGGLQEFAGGGWTGPGGRDDVAGVVHADEFVVPKHRVRALGGPGAVGALVGMPGYANGGPVLPLNIVSDTRSLESTMAGVASAMRAATPADGVGNGGVATASSSELVAFGRMLQRMGARVSEHPAFGGVTYGAHVPGSKHYSARAIDVNTRAGTSSLEQRELAPMMAMAKAAGFHVIFMSEGHYNHGHVASYKTGTPYVPRDGLAYLHEGERVVPREQNVAAASPGYGMGPGWGGAASARPVVISLAGATVTGRFEFGSDGLVRLVDGRIDGKLGDLADTITYAGGV